MKRILALLIIFLCASYIAFSQVYAISPARMERIKKATVRISTIDGDNIGTGFIINGKCQIVTCYHVVKPYIDKLLYDPGLGEVSRIIITLNGWHSFFVKKMLYSNPKFNQDSLKFNDIAILEPVVVPPYEFDSLKLGDWQDAKEGEAIYACGYPLTMTEPFVKTGMVSNIVDETLTHSSDTSTSFIVHHRRYAFLDITLNKGNSGSPIVLIGNSFEDDRVIGIADFIVNTKFNIVEKAVEDYSNIPIGNDSVYGRKIRSIIYALAFVAENTTNGISGCYPIEYIYSILSQLHKLPT